MNRDSVNMLRYKRVASLFDIWGLTAEGSSSLPPAYLPGMGGDAKRQKINPIIHTSLKDIIDTFILWGFNKVTNENRNRLSKMAASLTKEIAEEDGSSKESKIEASKRILNAYVAQLKGKTDETATKLNLSNLGSKSLSAEIEKLTSLVMLDLSDNKLTSLPREIWKLTNLKELRLGFNLFTRVPPEIWKLTNLGMLDLCNNQLTSLSAKIEKLTSLGMLDLSENKLTSLPRESWKLTSLEDLMLGNTLFTRVPPEIWKLTKLKRLDLGGNFLASVPPEIGNLINLTWLDLEYNLLTSLPPEIGNLINLKYLSLNTNYLPETESEKLPEYVRAEGVGEQTDREYWLNTIASVQQKIVKINRAIGDYKERSNTAADSEDEEVEPTLTGLPLDAKELIMTKLPIGKLQMMNMVNREYKVLSRNVYVKKLKAEQTEVNRVKDHLTAIGIANDWEVAEDPAVAG